MDIKNLYKAVSSKYPDIKEWEAASIGMEYGQEAIDSIEVATLCETTRLPWESLEVFNKVAVVINDRPVLSTFLQDLSPNEVCYAVYILKRDYPSENFNDDVTKYIASILDDWGFCIAPADVEFTQRFLVLKKLSKEQQVMQRIYLEEVGEYKRLMGAK